MRSSCFVHQSTKAGSTEECGQTILAPRGVKQGSAALSPSRSRFPVDPEKRHNIPRQVLKAHPQ